MNLSLDARELSAVLRHSGHIVQLAGAISESALIKDVLWDSVLQEVLHVDLSRVDASEAVEIVLTVELRGTAKGLNNGGVLNFVSHEVEIKCPANMIPEKLELKIADLDVGQIADSGTGPEQRRARGTHRLRRRTRAPGGASQRDDQRLAAGTVSDQPAAHGPERRIPD